MAKDGNDGRNGGQENSGNNKGHRRNERRLPTITSKAILKIGPPPTSKQTTSIKLKDTMGNEVKERLDNWRDGDDEQILIDMLDKSISIYDIKNLGRRRSKQTQKISSEILQKDIQETRIREPKRRNARPPHLPRE